MLKLMGKKIFTFLRRQLCLSKPVLINFQLHYDGYNKRYGGDGVHERLDWSHIQVRYRAGQSV